MRFTCCENNANETITVKGIPFRVRRENGLVQKLTQCETPFEGSFEAVFCLGMSVSNWGCSEWWGPKPAYYDSSERAFIGDVIGRIRVTYENNTQAGIPVIFGVNAFNYEIFCGGLEKEHLPCFDAPYDEPFRSDAQARKLLDDTLLLMDNDDPEREKYTRWVFALKLNPSLRVRSVCVFGERLGGVCVSAFTGLNAGQIPDADWKIASVDDFLAKKWLVPAERLKHRLYTYDADIPQTDPVKDIPGFKMPDIRFYGCPEAEIYTNVYRQNIHDMSLNKVTEDGMPHTSSGDTVNFGCYVGLGTYTPSQAYSKHIWTRDTGRLLIELINLGDFERPVKAADRMFECLYMPFNHDVPPHWKRIANLLPDKNVVNRDLDATENDGHASIMMFLYALWAKGAVGNDWVVKNGKPLRDAADFILWEIDNPAVSGFDRVLYSYSEASSQNLGGFDLYSNIISASALEGFGRMFRAAGDAAYADKLDKAAETIRKGVDEVFMCDTPNHGRVYTDTTEDCWTYEYKRFCEALMYTDLNGYDLFADCPDRFEIMERTFDRQKEEYYSPFSGRQMGYGQGYLNNTALLLDRFDEITPCLNASARECWHGYDHNYIVPEGVIIHGSGAYWFRNSDLGNGVQQAEIVKAARLMAGIDDLNGSRVRLVPRLPYGWTKLEAKDYPVKTEAGLKKVSFAYERISEPVSGCLYACAPDGSGYAARIESDTPIESLRFGPFDTDEVTVNGGRIIKKQLISGKWFVYAGEINQ